MVFEDKRYAVVKDKSLLIFSGFWPTVSNTISGIFVVQQVKAFVDAGVSVTVVIPATIGRGKARYLKPEELGLNTSFVKFHVIPIIRLPEKLSSMPGAILANYFSYGLMVKRFFFVNLKGMCFDGCIIHGERMGGLSFPLWNNHLSCKTVVVIHGEDPFWGRRENVRAAQNLFQKLSFFCKKIVLVGSPLLNHVARLGIPEKKIAVVPNGTTLPEVSEIKFPKGVSSKPVILSVSNLVPLKGIDDNLKALATLLEQHPDLDWEYRVIGDGSCRTELERLADELQLGSRVNFLGRLTYEETMNEMTKSDIFSLPSWGEAFGIVYLEAMARKKPVIGCEGNGAADIVTHGKDGFLVKPKSPENLARCLGKLIMDESIRHSLGVKARIRAEEFTWASNVKSMLQILEVFQ